MTTILSCGHQVEEPEEGVPTTTMDNNKTSLVYSVLCKQCHEVEQLCGNVVEEKIYTWVWDE